MTPTRTNRPPRRIATVVVLWALAGCQAAQKPDFLADARRASVPASPTSGDAYAMPVRPTSGEDGDAIESPSSDVAITGVQTTGGLRPPHASSVYADAIEPALPQTPDDPALGAFPVTLEQLEQTALANNPTLAEAQARIDAARGKWVQGGLPPNTHVGYSGQQLGSSGAAEQQGVFVGQEFVLGGKLRLNRAVAWQEIQKAEQLWAAQQQRVLTDVRLGFYDVLISQRRVELSRQLVEIADDARETAERLLQAEEAGRVDLLRAQVELQSAQLQLATARIAYTAAWSRLAAVIGTPDVLPVPLAGELAALPLEIDLDAARLRLLTESPEIAAAQAEAERARWALQRAQAEPFPNLDVQAVVQRDNAIDGTNANLQVTLPIPWLNRNQGGIQQAYADVIAAEQAVGRVELSLRQRLATVFQQYDSARNQVEEYSKTEGILENSRAALDLTRAAYEAGELRYVDLLAAQRTYSETNLAYIAALNELWQSKIRIDGLLLDESLTDARGE